MSAIRNRVQRMEMVQASKLLKNDRNVRRHPIEQQGAIAAIFSKVGFAGAVIVRETPEGLEIIDGHLRAEQAGDDPIPVLVTDLTREEADKVLATYDQIGRMADIDGEALDSLIGDIGVGFFDDDASLRKMLADFKTEDITESEAKSLDSEYSHSVDGLQLKPHEHYDYLVVLARDTHSWNVLCDLLDLKPSTLLHWRATKKKIAKNRQSTIGTSRAILADALIERLTCEPKH